MADYHDLQFSIQDWTMPDDVMTDHNVPRDLHVPNKSGVTWVALSSHGAVFVWVELNMYMINDTPRCFLL